MRQLERGMFARSLAGHDKGRLYIVLEENEKYVLLTDGIHHTVENPKKKKRMHIQPDYEQAFKQAAGEAGQQALDNQKIMKAIEIKEGHTCQSQM